jgi:DNA-binding NtrC family response regulator
MESSPWLLMVDDEIDFLESAGKALTRLGFKVETVNDGETALELMEHRQFDVAVIDIKMPGIDGIQLFHEIQRKFPSLPVIILTGHGSIQQAFQTSKQGVYDYLSKPCDMDKLAETCRSAMSRCEERDRATQEPDTELPIRVLLVDDEKDFLEVVRKVLGRRGMDVFTASDGEEGLRRIQSEVFDVVVLDMRMPGPSGLDVLQEIKSTSPTTEVILLTGHPSVALALRGLRQGAFDFVVKPQNVDALARKIREAALRRRAAEAKRQERLVDDLLDKYPS